MHCKRLTNEQANEIDQNIIFGNWPGWSEASIRFKKVC